MRFSVFYAAGLVRWLPLAATSLGLSGRYQLLVEAEWPGNAPNENREGDRKQVRTAKPRLIKTTNCASRLPSGEKCGLGLKATVLEYMSYLLVRDGKPPFVLTVENAKSYFDPSSLVKKSKKDSITLLYRFHKLRNYFAEFLQENTHDGHLLSCRVND